MTQSFKTKLASLGALRLGLFTIAIVNSLLPLIDSILQQLLSTDLTDSIWAVFPTLVAPVMAPLLLVVILFDYVMSRVRAEDETGDARAHFISISRIELLLMVVIFIYWLPFFMALTD